MAQQAVVAAVNQRLANLWTNCAVIDANNSDNQPPSDGSPFLSVQYPIANEDQISIGSPGNNLFRETGAVRFVLSIQTGSGNDWALGWMDELRAMFRAKQFDGVNTFAPSSPVLDDSNVTGGYWMLSSATPYYFDFFS